LLRAETEELLRVEDLSLSYGTGSGRARALENVSLSLSKKEFVAIVGESGAGKSTLALSIIGLLPRNAKPDGRIYLRDRNLLELDRKEWENVRGNEIGMIFQEPLTSLNPIEKVGDQLSETIARNPTRHQVKAYDYSPGGAGSTVGWTERLSMLVPGREGRYLPEVHEWLKKVRIPDPESVAQRYPFQLSGGMMQRVMIAMALSQRPSLLLADEPTTALDVTTQAQILKLMKQLIDEQDTAIILVTHDLGVAVQVADRIIVMYAGEIMEDGSTENIFTNPLHPYTKALLKCYPKSAKSKERLETIPGSIPDLRMEIPGCKFAERCAYVSNACRSEKIKLVEVEDRHFVRCTLFY
jgi:peptide/nickel transport system ATP-binding protein